MASSETLLGRLSEHKKVVGSALVGIIGLATLTGAFYLGRGSNMPPSPRQPNVNGLVTCESGPVTGVYVHTYNTLGVEDSNRNFAVRTSVPALGHNAVAFSLSAPGSETFTVDVGCGGDRIHWLKRDVETDSMRVGGEFPVVDCTDNPIVGEKDGGTCTVQFIPTP